MPANSNEAAPVGEEWKSMDGAKSLYNPDSSADVLAAARRGIDSHRKGDCCLRLVDASGAPLAGVPVEIVQKRHAFLFGDQLWDLDAMIRDEEEHTGRARAWKQRFAEVFNCATNLCYWTERPRNDGSKTEDRQGEPRLENFARTVDWCIANGIVAKGHPLFWSIDKCVPEWVKRYDVETQMKFAEARVRSLVARFKGRVKLWDAVNEAIWEAAPKHLPQRRWPHIETVEDMAEYIQPVLRWCREEDPDALYLINDYGTENGDRDLIGSNGSRVNFLSQRRRYIALANYLRDNGYAPDALGLQSHTGWVTHHSEQAAVYDEYAAAGWEVHITEFWAHTEAIAKDFPSVPKAELLRLQAEYVANFLTVAFGHPGVGAFSFWGFMGMAIQWFGRSSHELLPVFARVRDLIHRDWQTRVQAQTDADGVVRFRGFYGEYALRYEAPCREGFQIGHDFSLQKGMRGTIEFQSRHLMG